MLEAEALRDFLQSSQYDYITELRRKAETQWTIDHFQVVRKLGPRPWT